MLRNLKQATETSTESSAPSTGFTFTAKRKELGATVRKLARVAPKGRTTLPILGYVAIRATADGMVLATTDLNVTCIVAPAWTVQGRGGICVPVKALGDALKKLPDGDVTVTTSDRALVLSIAGVEMRVAGIPDREFPKVPAVLPGDKPILSTVDGETLGGLFERVAHAMCLDETRFHMCGISFRYTGTEATCIATDGHRLTLARSPLQRAGDFSTPTDGLIVPLQAAKVLIATLGKGPCGLGMVGSLFAVRQGDTTIALKLTDAKYPPHEQVIPKANTRIVVANREILLAAVERVGAITNGERGLLLSGDGTVLTLRGDHPDLGTACETVTIDAMPDGDDFKIGLNAKYLADALKACDDERVCIAIDGNNGPDRWSPNRRSYELSPVLVRDADERARPVLSSSHLSVVMPMRI